MPRTPDVSPNVEALLGAVLQYQSKHQDTLMDGTFLGTLRAPSHHQLILACADEPNKTIPMIRALTALGDAYIQMRDDYRVLRVSDAIRMLSKLREAAMDKPNPSDTLRSILFQWIHEETRAAQGLPLDPNERDDDE